MFKKVPVWFVLLILWFSVVSIVLFGWAVWHVTTVPLGENIFSKKTANLIVSVARFPGEVKDVFSSFKTRSLLITPDLYPDVKGFKSEKNYVDSNYILLSTYDYKNNAPVVKLLRLHDQKVVHSWEIDFAIARRNNGALDKYLDTVALSSIRMAHPLLFPDGSIVFNTAGSVLVKIDKDSKLVWVLDGAFAHSLEFDADGNIWAQSTIKNSDVLPGVLDGFENDAIIKVSPEGEVLFQKSVADILVENGYRGLLIGSLIEVDLTHLNDIQPALKSSKYWAKGDLLISLRNKSTIFLYRPSTNKVIWLKTGPWLNQHDVDFVDSTRIGVFGNDMVRKLFSRRQSIGDHESLLNGYNNEYVYDFKTNETTTPYTEFFKKAKVSTLTEGRSDILQDGDLFIEETNNNRMLRGNEKDIKWQYVERINDHSLAALSWSRFITKKEFEKLLFLKIK